jgi:hypothetical protein
MGGKTSEKGSKLSRRRGVELPPQARREAALTVGNASLEGLQSRDQAAAGSSVKSLQEFGLSIHRRPTSLLVGSLQVDK